MAAALSYCKPSPFIGQFPSNFGKPVSLQGIEISTQASRITALFWGSKKSVKHQPVDSSLGDFTLTGSETEVFLSHDLV
ncbi:Acyl-CoA N-acyltransferase isoform 1 [Gossypium australe]|uniref:Acyl-CoA N-acyltransferase isoform 1 n=1 Tax=Gossypium australe TaxID=47621 RepID=A0A5B6WBM7_9ROSI|nr:Acyl-CoA N-acyltransferase isoform 1 [Gossypium australe]